MPPLTDADRIAIVHRELQRRANYQFDSYFPETGPYRRALYLKHMEFFGAGASKKQRLFMAANRVGKSKSGAYETTCHLTGLYPPWWNGRRFDKPVEMWAAGTTGETVRDIIQQLLFGAWKDLDAEDAGPYTGMVPLHLITHKSRRPHGIPGALETVWVRHVSGGLSQIGLKTYEQGRKSFEGTAKDAIWCDEEPPEDCYTEMLYRTLTTKGIVYTTFTPLQGLSDVVSGFLEPADEEARHSKAVIQAGWDDVPHLDADEKAMLIASTPPFQRAARTKGTPQLGAGAIYAVPEDEIVVSDFEIPRLWKRCWGGDAGGGAKPTAAVWLTMDPETGVVYLYANYKRESPEPAVHLAGIKARGEWIPGVMDSAALIITQSDAEQLISVYQRGGLDVTLPDKAVESGIQAVWELMSAGRFAVFRSCEAWLKEFRKYHRDSKGRIVKVDDHLMDSTRYAVYSGMLRAKSLNEAQPTPKRGWTHAPSGSNTGYMAS